MDDTTTTAVAMPRSLRDRLPKMSPAHAEVMRELHAEQFSWSGADGTLYLHGIPTSPGDGVFEVDADGTRLGLFLLSQPPAAGADELQWQDRRGRARVLAWSLAHESTLMRLSDALGTSLLPVLDAHVEAPDPNLTWLALYYLPYPDGAPIHGALRAPATWLQALVGRADEPEEAQDLGNWPQLPTHAAISVAAPPLTVNDLRSLRPGDVIVVGNARLPPVHATAAGLRWPVRAVSDGWRVDGDATQRPPYQEIPRMSEAENTEATGEEETPVVEDPAGRLPVEIEFELGSVEMKISEVAGLQPGYVFALPSQLEGANVTIRANGQVTGQGELVAVGDTLGVRLLSWS